MALPTLNCIKTIYASENLMDKAQWDAIAKRQEKWFKDWAIPTVKDTDNVGSTNSKTDQRATLNKVQEEIAQVTKKHWGQEVKPLFCNPRLLKLIRKVIYKSKVERETLIQLEEDPSERRELKELKGKIVEELLYLLDLGDSGNKCDNMEICHFLLQGDCCGSPAKEAKAYCEDCKAVMCKMCKEEHHCQDNSDSEEEEEEDDQEENSETTKTSSRTKRKALNDWVPTSDGDDDNDDVPPVNHKSAKQR